MSNIGSGDWQAVYNAIPQELQWQEHFKKQLIRVQAQTFADWCAEVRELAGERWPEVLDQCATLYAVWGGGATPVQALHMVELILCRQRQPKRPLGAAAMASRRLWQ